jgi:hypothetical protein
MKDKELRIDHFIRPKRVGKIQRAQDRFSPGPQETGVECLGMVLTDSTRLVAGIFGGRSTNLNEFLATTARWSPCQLVQPDNDTPVPFSISFEDLETYAWEDLDFGKLVLLLHKGALASQQITQLGDLPNFFCWSKADEDQPALGLLFEKLQKIVALPLDPQWYPRIWDELLAEGSATTCTCYGGFSNLWEVIITKDEWQELVLSLVRRKVLG